MEYGTKHGMEWEIENFFKYGTYSPNLNMCIICATMLVNIRMKVWNSRTEHSKIKYVIWNRHMEQKYIVF